MTISRDHIRAVGLAVLGWTAVAVVFALPGLSAGGEGWRPLSNACAQWWAWGLVAPLIVAADRRLPMSEREIVKRLLAHVALSLVLTVLNIYVAATIRSVLGLTGWGTLSDPHLLDKSLRGSILWQWLVYWLIVGAWLARQYYQRYLSSELRVERMERLSSEARLHALRLQLDPHFLFNALNTISAQVESDPKLARRMIEHVGDLLRLTLETQDREEVPLTEELAFLEHYLAIQRIRFGDRLRFETTIAEDVRYALVPALTVQPLVENAIRHGISKRASGGTSA
jgi:two-component system LytT family sensor kinase